MRNGTTPPARRVLLIAYHFPPVGEVGTFRTLKFAKYLPEFGFTPVILTVRNRSFPTVDLSLLTEVPSEATVVETFSAEHRLLRAPSRLGISPKWFLLPDPQIGWLPFAVREGEALIRSTDVRVIYATAPPYTSLLVGRTLKQRTGLPLVIDFRDPWTQNVFTRYPTRLHRSMEERMERAVLTFADRIITTTDEMGRGLAERYPIVRDRWETIPNGFDPADFEGLARTPAAGRFTIAYTGRLYGPRTAEPFLLVLKSLAGQFPAFRDSLLMVFAGPRDTEVARLAHRLGLRDNVEQTGFLSHRDSLQVMVNADVLLLVLSEREVVGNGIAAMMIPGKTFEYLGARRPILALAPDGEAARLITRTASGVVVRPDDGPGIERAVFELFSAWQRGTLAVPPRDLSMFERRSLTARLATTFESVVSTTRQRSGAS